MPGHPLHAFFRLLVESPPDLKPAPQPDKALGTGGSVAAAGPSTAFALLGQVYGDSDEDEEGEAGESDGKEARGTAPAGQVAEDSDHTEPAAGADHGSVPGEGGKPAATSADREEHRDQGQVVAETSKDGDLPPGQVVDGPQSENATEVASEVAAGDAGGGATVEITHEAPDTLEAIVQPDEATTKIIMKMAEYIARNGPAFEAIVRERDEQDAQRHWEQTGQPGPRRFPFLDSQHPYHPFFSACLRQALPSAAQDSTQHLAAPGQQQQQQHDQHVQGGEHEANAGSRVVEGENIRQQADEQAEAQDNQEAPGGHDLPPAKRQKQEQGQETEQGQGREHSHEDGQGHGVGEELPEKKQGPISGRGRVGWIPKVKPLFVRKRKKETELDQQCEQEEDHKQEGKVEEVPGKKEEAELGEKAAAESHQAAGKEQGAQEQDAAEGTPGHDAAVTVSAALAAVLAATSRRTPPPDDTPGLEQPTDAPSQVDTSMPECLVAEPKAAQVAPRLANGEDKQQAEPRRKLSAAEVAALVRKGKAGLGGGPRIDTRPQQPQSSKKSIGEEGSSQSVAVALQLDEDLLQELEGPSERSRPQAASSKSSEAQIATAGPADDDAEKQRIRKKRLEKARQLAALMKDKQSGSTAEPPSSIQGSLRGNELSQDLRGTLQDAAQKKGVEPLQGVEGSKARPPEHGRISAQAEVPGTGHLKVPDPRVKHVDLSHLLKLRTEAAQDSDHGRDHVKGT